MNDTPGFADEAFVLWLVEGSRRALDMVSEQVDLGSDTQAALETLRSSEVRLRPGHNDSPITGLALFAHLAGHLRECWSRARSGRPFVAEHLKLLIDHGSAVASRLGLGAGAYALDLLLDPEGLVKTLRSAGLPVPARRQSQTLLDSLFDGSWEVELEHGCSLGWGPVLVRDGWLRPFTTSGLRLFARTQGWDESDPTRVLAALLDETEMGATPSWGSVDSGPTPCDSLAICYIRSRLLHAAYTLEKEAVERAQMAQRMAPHFRATRVLPAWVQHQSGWVMCALRELLLEEVEAPLGEVVSHAEPEVVRVTETADENACLVVDLKSRSIEHAQTAKTGKLGGILRWLGGRSATNQSAAAESESGRATGRATNTVEIQCPASAAGAHLTILKLRNLSDAEVEHLSRELSQLKVAKLSGSGELGERLLATRIRITDEARRHQLESIEQVLPQLAQAVVTCGIEIPTGTAAPWAAALSDADRVRYAPLKSDEDLVFPTGPAAIVEELVGRCEQSGTPCSVIDHAWQPARKSG